MCPCNGTGVVIVFDESTMTWRSEECGCDDMIWTWWVSDAADAYQPWEGE